MCAGNSFSALKTRDSSAKCREKTLSIFCVQRSKLNKKPEYWGGGSEASFS